MTVATDFWGIPFSIEVIFYVLAAIAVLILLTGFWRKARLWASGKDDKTGLHGAGPINLIWLSITTFFSGDCFLARRVFGRSLFRGILLVVIIWSSILLFLGTVGRTINYYVYSFLVDWVWLAFSAILEIAGLLLLLGLLYALARRYVFKPERMVNSIEDGSFLLLLFLIILSGFVAEGGRIVVQQPPNADWSYVGYVFGLAILSLAGGNLSAVQTAQPVLWMVHALLALVLIAYLPYSKAFHLFASQITTQLAKERKRRVQEIRLRAIGARK